VVDFTSPGIQTYTIGTSGTYDITADGAQGGGFTRSAGGSGASVSGDVYLQAGTKLEIVVGAEGGAGGGIGGGEGGGLIDISGGGGGGGSFVIETYNGSAPVDTKGVSGRLRVQKEYMGVFRVFARKRIALQDRTQLRAISDEHPYGFANVSEQALFKQCLNLRSWHVAVKDHIAAGNVSLDATETQCCAQRLEVGHRELAGAADIYGPQQCDVRRHGEREHAAPT
jgi:hypothetical protein